MDICVHIHTRTDVKASEQPSAPSSSGTRGGRGWGWGCLEPGSTSTQEQGGPMQPGTTRVGGGMGYPPLCVCMYVYVPSVRVCMHGYWYALGAGVQSRTCMHRCVHICTHMYIVYTYDIDTYTYIHIQHCLHLYTFIQFMQSALFV